MIVTFDKEYLRDLYVSGKGDKKHRYQPQIIRGYQKCIARMIDSSSIEQLARIGSLHYEVLSGKKQGISSIRINIQYRIEFIANKDGEITICNILELSNHYQ